MSTPFFQDVDPMPVPDPVTPADGPSDPAGYARVTPAGTGPAPYDISGPQDIAGITAGLSAANSLAGSGVIEGAGMGPRQAETLALLQSPQGAGAMSILAGFPDYENADVRPGADLETPIQGHGVHPGTTQAGVPQFPGGLGSGVSGVPPEGGSMGAGGLDYPGTVQDGLTQYG